MQELYNMFESQSHVLQNHNTRRRAATNALKQQKHIKDRPHDLPVMDKFQTKKTEVTIETWESIRDAVESLIKDGQVACKRRWLAAETLLSFLDMPSLDSIDQAFPPKLKLEEIERNFPTSKEQIQEINQLTMQEITR